MSQDYNRRHRTTTLPQVAGGSPVLVDFGGHRVTGTTVRPHEHTWLNQHQVGL